MSYRRPNGMSVFFPDKGMHPDDIEKRSDESTYAPYSKDRYITSHKDLYIPSSRETSYRPSRPSSRRFPSVHPSSRRFDKGDRYVPSNSTTTPKSDRSEAPTEPTTASSSPPKDEQSAVVTNASKQISEEALRDTWYVKIKPELLEQAHALDANGDLRFKPQVSESTKLSYRVTYDPELSKDKSKGKTIIVKSHTDMKTKDPRHTDHKAQMKNVKRYSKVPYKSLPLPKFSYDKFSVGPPPPTEILISGLGSSTNDIYLINQLKSLGEVAETESILDPSTGIPLGLLRVKFGGPVDKAFRSCKRAVKELDQSKVDGKSIKIIIKQNEEVLSEVINREIGSTITKIKLAGLESKKAVLPSAPKAILKAISRHSASKQMKEAALAKSSPVDRAGSERPSPTSKPIVSPQLSQDSAKQSKTDVSPIEVSPELVKYIKGRSFLFIASKYIKNRLTKNDIKRALETYDWTRVLSDDTGIFIVFNSPKEANRCFLLENGKPVFSVNLYMELQLPEGYQSTEDDNRYTLQQRDVLDEATSLLTKELEDALQKDIRSKIIAPAILEFLNIDNFPDLKPKVLPFIPAAASTRDNLKEEAENEESSAEPESVNDDGSIEVFSLMKQQPKLPSFKKKIKASDSSKSKIVSPKKRKLLPMNYKLNFEDDEDSDHIDSTATTPSLEKIEIPPLEGPVRKKAKMVAEKEEKVAEKVHDIKESLLYSSSSEDEEEPAITTKESLPTTPEEDKMDIDVPEKKLEEDKDHSIFDRLHQPVSSEVPIPVYEPEDDDLLLDIEGFQKLIKDEEDFMLLKELLENEKVTDPLGLSPDYWCWKTKHLKSQRESNAADSTIVIPEQLENETGSYRSQGYSKIPDEVKIDYLPHRKRVHDPLSTIQVDNEEAESSKVQSSRVNRANNRRFAYEVSNFNTENEILTMNQLNKRKKPVSFARSAIHNWGLYALEPIAEREMIIEYVGERIRQQVADFREKAYLKSGIGSSYLFRVDENTVIDATKKGGIARFINHSCVPSCTAKIIKVEGQKRIVIYALRDIGTNEELTYDYKFERETNDNERVRCLCGAPGCKGYLN